MSTLDQPAEPANRAVYRFILLTDIAGSSRLSEAYPQEYSARLAQHNALIEQQVEAQGGSIYKNLGDGYLALFESAISLALCARELALAFSMFEPLTPDEPLRVRIALHAGTLHPAGPEYFGPPLNRASRICQVCNPGQLLCSGPVAFALGPDARTSLFITDFGLHHLRDLAEPEHLFQLDHPGFAQHAFPPLATLNNRPNNLVSQPNAFIGRDCELGELEGLLVGARLASPSARTRTEGGTSAAPTVANRLLTITAPGGYGKSRLAAQLCANLLPRFERGCFMAYLAPVRDALGVPLAVAGALGFQFSGSRDPVVQLCDYLRAKELLLCLDNFEHVLDSAPLVKAFLEAAPKLKIIVTSREPLRLEGELIYRLEPLEVETEAAGYSDAEKLFADRARLVKRDFAVDGGNHALVHDICVKLNGIPLAIELAAAWMDGFTLEELADELAHQLELEARGSDKPARHHSLKACLDWSWNLLGAAQQELLMRLAVFRGGFFSDAASVMLGRKGMALRSALLKLCDKSWLYTREVEGQTRFLLRDMLAHEYAFEKLRGEKGQGPRAKGQGEEPVGRAAVPAIPSGGGGPPPSGSASVPLASGSAGLQTGSSPSGARAYGPHPDAATECGATGEEAGRDACATVMDEGRQAGTPAATRGGSLYESAVAAHAAYFAALAEREGPRLNGGGTPDGGAAQMQALRTWRLELQNIEAALDTALARSELAWLLPIAKHLQLYLKVSSALVSMRERYCQLHVAALSLGSAAMMLSVRLALGSSLWRLGQYEDARDTLDQSLQLAREIGDRHGEALSFGNLGNVYYMQGDYVRATELQSRALAITREIGDRHGEAGSLVNLANSHYMQGDYARAAALQRLALAIRPEIGDRAGEAGSLGSLGLVYYMQGDFVRAAEFFGQAFAIFCEIGDRQGKASTLLNLANVHCLQGDFPGAVELQGQGLALQREIGNRAGEALSLSSLGSVHYLRGDSGRAAELQSQALAIQREIGDRHGQASSLGSLGLISYSQGRYSLAAELQSQALVIRLKLGAKSEIAVSCACAGAVLAALGRLCSAALALHGAFARAAELGHVFDVDELQGIEPGLNRLDAAVAAGEITAAQLAAWKAEGEALSLEELAQFTLDALGAATGSGNGSADARSDAVAG